MFEKGDIYTWREVSELHLSRNGIHVARGRLVSLLTDLGRINPCYPDFHTDGGSTLHYTGSGRRGDQKMDVRNQALSDAIASGISVPLFNKLGTNRWEYLGKWQVIASAYVREESHQRMVWRFTLRSAE